MKRVLLTRRWPAVVEAHLRERFEICLNGDDRPLDKATLIAAMAEFITAIITGGGDGTGD